jgi:hypothetical protein
MSVKRDDVQVNMSAIPPGNAMQSGNAPLAESNQPIKFFQRRT